jgi:hypothetical protein
MVQLEIRGKSGPFAKNDIYLLLPDSPRNVPGIERAVDAMFRDSPEPTKTEGEKNLELDFISLGNV